MKRLTIKNSDGSYSQPMDTNFHEIFNKLGEFEDVLEKYGIESAEDLDNIINSIRINTFIDIENKEILELENANLKSELAELKQKAIVPKFKIGQEVWFVSDTYTARYTKVRHMKIEEISISSIFVERGVMYAGDDWAGISESELFATKEEAEQKLAEIKGELGYKGVVRVLNQQDARIKELNTKLVEEMELSAERRQVIEDLTIENNQQDKEIEELNEKLQDKVADLEAKLAESEKQIKDAIEAGNMAVDSWCKIRLSKKTRKNA